MLCPSFLKALNQEITSRNSEGIYSFKRATVDNFVVNQKLFCQMKEQNLFEIVKALKVNHVNSGSKQIELIPIASST